MDATILRQLEAHALAWDEPIRYQTQHVEQYREALRALEQRGEVYRCSCTRARLAADSRPGPDGPVYPGTCRSAPPSGRAALRLVVPAEPLCIDDGGQGRTCRDLPADVGDFVVRRADGQVAYQLACAVDEHAQRITEVVRGADLLGSTFRQWVVQDRLRLPHPAYRHLPVLLDDRGRKLSKQNHAAAVQAQDASRNLLRCLTWLGQSPDPKLGGEAPSTVVQEAIRSWDAAKVARAAQITGS